ncbi:MAG TPA: META domain-containing protein [Jatrophihabitans sp.]|nr:META domain-containing protein [Jatrophihabitans sp.]
MSDERMDARLRSAGEAWRTATESTALEYAEPAPITPTTPTPPRRRHRATLLASAAVVAAALVAGGAYVLGRTTGHQSAPTQNADATLTGTVWRLLGYGNDRPRTDSLATLYISSDGNLVADDTCELVTAKATGARPRLRDLTVRNYNCTDAVGEITFDRGLRALRHDPTWTLDGDRLTVSGGGTTMHLAAAPHLPAPTADRPTYTDTTWALTTVTAAGAAQHPAGKPTLRIAGDRIVASDTCNTLSGPVTLDGSTLHVEDGLAQTAMACPGNTTQDVVDRILTDGARFDLRGPTLTVTKAGAGTLTYAWTPADQQATDPDRLTATAWQLRTVAGDRARPGTTLRVTGDGALTLTAGCETVSAHATVAAGAITATGVPDQPRSGCPPELSTLHSFLAGGPALWHLDGNQLIVNQSGSQGFALVFDASTPAPAATVELRGTWRLTGVEENDGNSASGSGSSDSGTTLTLTAGGFRVQTPCGRWSGTVQATGATITVGAVSAGLTSTCGDEPARTVWKVLRGTLGWRTNDGQLELTKGNVTLTFAR